VSSSLEYVDEYSFVDVSESLTGVVFNFPSRVVFPDFGDGIGVVNMRVEQAREAARERLRAVPTYAWDDNEPVDSRLHDMQVRAIRAE
jgi:hypothetical protein